MENRRGREKLREEEEREMQAIPYQTSTERDGGKVEIRQTTLTDRKCGGD